MEYNDLPDEMKDMLRKAEQGDVKAAYALGKFYDDNKDWFEAIKWYRLAAEHGDTNACEEIAIILNLGGAEGDDYIETKIEAVKWWRLCDELKDNCYPGYGLGNCHYGDDEEQYAPHNKEEAVRWIEHAAKQGNPEAQLKIGFCYNTGDGVPKDATKAARWFCLAAEQEIPDAQYVIGLCYKYGKGVPEDETQAARWLRLACEKGGVADRLADDQLEDLLEGKSDQEMMNLLGFKSEEELKRFLDCE